MTRRKVFIAFAAAVMILVLTAALFVACDKTKTYTVTFKDGETVVKTVSVQDGATIADADVPADLEDTDDAVFEGWFNGDAAFDKTAAITSDVTYTAKWTSIFTVTFKDGDQVVKTAKVKSGEKIASADVPTDLADTSDATFEGWFNGEAAFDADATITANVTYTSKWSGLLTVTFKDGDQVVKTAKVKSGEKIAAADIPTDLEDTQDAAFEGWFNGEAAFDKDAAITSNATYTAKWTSIYTVTFQNGDQVVKTAKVKSGEKIASADIPSDLADTAEAVFGGWFNGDAAFDKDAVITSNVTYTAKWIAIYRVTFMNGDQVVKVAKVKSGEKIASADIPSNLADKADAAFDGWFNGSVAFNKDAVITSNVTYTAKWTSIYTVTFKNGDEVVATAKVKSGAVISAQDVPGALADTDYAFLGWFVGDAAYDSSAAVTSDVVVNAKFSTFLKSYFGTWHGATEDWTPVAYTVVVDATSIHVTIDSAEAQVATSIIVDQDGTVTFKLGETDYRLYANYDGNLCIYESSAVKLSAELAGRVHVSSSDIVGTYTTEGGHTIVINKTFAKVDGVLGTYFSYSNSSGYSWSVDDNYSSLAYDSSAQAWIYKETSSSAGDKLIVPELVAIDVPAEFVGSWYGTAESFGSTTYFLVKVTEDGVFAYDPSFGFKKVGVATEYKDGALTVVGLDETITASIVDGKLAYKSDAAYGADYELTKGTVVVFEHKYSVYYIATLDEDGKIDFDTFALEDPQAAAGYTFKGWFSDLDLTTEFDEDATFAESAVFQSRVEKTGYVVTFKKSSSDSEPIVVIVDITSGKLAADQIPAALTYEDGSVFTGWYTSAGVKATADLAITADTTFVASSVKESDYEGYWINTESGKEALAVIADGKVTFGYGVNGLAYTFSTEDGSLSFSYKSYSIAHNFVIVKTLSGITITETYYDRDAEENVSNEYNLATPGSSSLTKKLAGTYQCSNSEIIVVLENGIVTKVDGVETTYGYIGGKVSAISMIYKTGSAKTVTTKTGKYDAKSLILGGKIYVKNPSSFASYYNSNNGTFYAYARDGKATLYTYKGTDYATIDGELAVGNIVTVTYGEKSFVAKITGASSYDIAGAERGTFTAESKESITFDGFGSATIGDKTYSYIVNAKGVVVLSGETTIGVTLDSEAKTYAEVASDGFAQTYIDASNDKYTMVFDGFGGATLTYSSYVYSGTYTLGTGTVTIAKINNSYNKTYSVEESGNVLVSTDGKKVLKTSGYVVENKVEQFNGYYVNGDEKIEISVAKDKTVTILLNGVAIKKVSVNWNGTVLTFNAADYDAPKTGWSSDFTIVKDGDNVKLSHACKQSYDSTYEEFETIQKDIVFTKSTKPSAETDGLEGTYKSGSNVITLDGKGNGTLNGNAFTYSGTGSTKQVSAFGAFSGSANTFTVTATGIDVSFDDEYQENTFKASFTKQAEETLDAFAGTWKSSKPNYTVVFDGKGAGTFNGTSITYTVNGTKATFTYGDFACEATLSGNKLTFETDDVDSMPGATLTKQA